MAKANNSGRTKKSHNYKPYDTSSSFVKRITAKVSEILPQSSSWVSRLFSPAPKLNVREREELEEEDEEEEERQPPSKRICFGPSETSEYSHQNNVNRLNNLDQESGEISPILSSRLDDDRAVPGPSGLHLRNFVSSTPAVRQTAVESSPKVTPGLVKRTPISELKKNVNKRSSLNLSSSSTVNSPSQPSFDTFVFRNPLNKSGLRPRSSINESCFYPGETTFGGSSARVSLPVDQPKARVVSVTASPTLQRDTIGTSALRILKALEQFSTPVLDAKKIPIRTEGNNPRKRKPPQPYEELIFPSMPELLSLKRREVVDKPAATETQQQPSPSTSAGGASSVKSSLGPSVSNPIAFPSSSSSTEYSLRPENTKETRVGSIKGRQKDEELEIERIPELNLPNVQLKITSFPKFDLSTTSSEVKSLPPKKTQDKVLSSSPEFEFSEPEIIEKVSSEKIIPDYHVSSFKFSEPLVHLETNKKPPRPLVSQNQSPPSDIVKKISPVKMKITSSNFKPKRKSVETTPKPASMKSFELKAPSEMKTGSIMEVFNKNSSTLENKLETSENNLLCGKCKANYDKNKGRCPCESTVESKKPEAKKSEKKIDSKTSQLKNDNSEVKDKNSNSEQGNETVKIIPKGFEGYKKPLDSWECKECFVLNKNASDTCVSCSTPKVGKSNTVNTSAAPSVFTFSSGGNKADPVTKTTTPFVSVVNSIKKPQGVWECNTCLVQNKVDVTSCVACSTPKPGLAAAEKPKPTFSFGIPATNSETNSFQFGINTNAQKNDSVNEKQPQFSFGAPNDEKKNSGFNFVAESKNDSLPKTNVTFPPLINSLKKTDDKWKCNTCLIVNKNDVSSCLACSEPKPGSNAVEKPKPTFSFGIPNMSTAPSGQFGSSLSIQKTETTALQPQFTFGNQSDEKKSNNSTLFKFGSSDAKSNSDSKPAFTFMNSEKLKESEPPKPVISNLFSFGNNAKDNKPDVTNVDDAKPLKKKVSFGKPLVSEKIISNDTNSALFGNVMSSKTNDVSTSNFTFSAKSPFENNSTTTKEPTKEPTVNTFTFGNTESNANLKPSITEPSKPIAFNAAPTENIALANNEHPPNTNIFGGSFTGFKPPESENKPFSFMGNSQGSQFTFNAVASGPVDQPFGNQQPTGGMPLFNQQQQTPAPSLFSQQSEPKPFLFGAPAQQQQQSVFTFTAAPQQSAGVGGNTPTFGGVAPPPNLAPVFDPNVKPSFNFTGGATPSFSAAAVPNNTEEKRRVRKAIRRTTQHR